MYKDKLSLLIADSYVGCPDLFVRFFPKDCICPIAIAFISNDFSRHVWLGERLIARRALDF